MSDRPRFGAFSTSKLDAAECPKKFYMQYIEKAEPLKISRFGTDLGSWIHDIAEMHTKLKMKDLPHDPIDLVAKYIETTPEAEGARGELEDLATKFHVAFYREEHNFYDAEQKLGARADMSAVPYASEEAWFRGRVDYTELSEDGVLRIVDFKTYPRIHSDDEINDVRSGVGFQLMGYMALMMALDPSIEMGYYEVYYFRFGTSRTSSYKTEGGITERRYISRDEVREWWDYLMRKIRRAESLTEFAPVPSVKSCQYCPFIDRCEKAIPNNEYFVRDDEQAESVFGDIIALKEVIERKKASLKSFDTTIGTLQSKEVKVDMVKLLEVLGIDKEYAKYLSSTQSNVKKLAKEYPEKKEALEACLVERVVTRNKYT